MQPPTEVSDEELDEAESSDGSYGASDVSAEDEIFDEVCLTPLLDGKSGVETEIRSLHAYIVAFISFNDGVSLAFLGEVYEIMEHLKALNVEEAKREMQQVHSTCM